MLDSLKDALGETWMLISWRSCGEQYLNLHVKHYLEKLMMINSHWLWVSSQNMCAGLMDNGEGLDSSSMHSNGHTRRLSLLRDNVLVLAVCHYNTFKNGQDIHSFSSFKCPSVFINHRSVQSSPFGWIKNKTKMKEIMIINQLSFFKCSNGIQKKYHYLQFSINSFARV